MNTPGNARSTASKEAIRAAMLDLLKDKKLETISVQEIVKKAGVNRSTFYAHYLDISDLMEKIEADMVAPLSKDMYAEGATVDPVFGGEALAGLVAYFRANQAFYQIFFSTSSKSKIIQEAAVYVRRRFVEPTLEKSRHFTQEEYAFQFEFCMTGFFGVIGKWLRSGCTEPDAVVAGVLDKLIWKCLA